MSNDCFNKIIIVPKEEKKVMKETKRDKLTRIVFICSFLIVFERPKNFFRIHSNMYHIDFGAGMILLLC